VAVDCLLLGDSSEFVVVFAIRFLLYIRDVLFIKFVGLVSRVLRLQEIVLFPFLFAGHEFFEGEWRHELVRLQL